MKKNLFLPTIILPLGILTLLLQGCYTQVATVREDESTYSREEQYSRQNDTSANYSDNDYWQPHNYIGFSYYYPTWRSYWAWDYGCVYPAYWEPWYWNPWYWGSAISIGYSYYPHYWGYWNSYPGYRHGGYGGSYNYYHSYAARNSGYHRNGTSRGTTGVNQSGRYGAASTGSMRGAASSLRDQGSPMHFGKSRNPNTGYNGRSTYRQSNGSRYNPSVQQPRHRDQGVTPGRTSREGSSHGRENYRNQGSTQRNSAPSYSPPPQSRTNSAPSAPAPRNDGGGGRQSSGSGRSHR